MLQTSWEKFVNLAMEANWLLMSLTLEAISHYLTRKNQYSLHKKLWSTNQRESIYNLWGWLVFTKWMGIHKNNKESKNDVPQRKIHRLFLPRVWCSCHDHTIRNIKRATPADIQKITNHRGIGLGNRPGKSKITVHECQQASFTHQLDINTWLAS